MVHCNDLNRTCLKALAGAAWVPVSSRYFSHEKLFGCLYSKEDIHRLPII